MKRRIRYAIPPEAAGEVLAAFLARRFPYHTLAEWTELARAGRVLVNGAAAPPAQALRPADLVEYLADDIPEPPAPLAAPVLYEDEELLAVDKPAGLPTHPGGRYFRHTLWAVLKEQHGLEAPAFVNRLDRETSGVVLAAKTPRAAQHCRQQFARRQVEKIYLAIVEGRFPDALTARGFLQSDPDSPVRKQRRFIPAPADAAAPPPAAGETAETAFRRLYRTADLSLVEARPLTGRLHQIRATLRALGYPIVGDKLYGPDPALFIRFCRDELSPADRQRLRLDRQALHAAVLRLRHPGSGQELRLAAPLPADLAALLPGYG